MKILQRISTEAKILGNLAIGYHRTYAVNNALKIGKTGFLPGTGQSYGVGIYLTYSLESQLRTNMAENYGRIIVKAKVNLNDFLIFEPEIAKLVYPRAYSLKDQLKRFKFPFHNKEEVVKLNTRLAQWYDKAEEREGLTSIVAMNFYNVYIADNIIKNVKGIIFKGKQDGDVIVAYDRKHVLPYAYAESTSYDVEIGQTPRWHKLDNKGAVQAIKPKTVTKDDKIEQEIYHWMIQLMKNKGWNKEKKNTAINNYKSRFFKETDSRFKFSIECYKASGNSGVFNLVFKLTDEDKNNTPLYRNIVISHKSRTMIQLKHVINLWIDKQAELGDKINKLIVKAEVTNEKIMSMIQDYETAIPAFDHVTRKQNPNTIFDGSLLTTTDDYDLQVINEYKIFKSGKTASYISIKLKTNYIDKLNNKERVTLQYTTGILDINNVNAQQVVDDFVNKFECLDYYRSRIDDPSLTKIIIKQNVKRHIRRQIIETLEKRYGDEN